MAAFHGNETKLKHIKWQLEKAPSNYSIRLSRSLHVTKGPGADVEAKKIWRDKLAVPQQVIAQFERAKLKILLGNDIDKLTTMKHLRSGSSGVDLSEFGLQQPKSAGTPQLSNVLAPISMNQSVQGVARVGAHGGLPAPGSLELGRTNPATGTKRKSDVIDLTGE